MRHARGSDKVFLALFAVFALIRAVDYFNGRALFDLLGMAGFVLLAIGVWMRAPATPDGGVPAARGNRAFAATTVGGILVLASFAMKWFG